jgi:hypothetical protein
MESDRTAEVDALLAETEAAHGRYEATELNGVYDQEWPRWYAAYAVDHGIGDLVGHPVTTDELAPFLARTYGEFEQADPRPDEAWTAYIARRITAEL